MWNIGAHQSRLQSPLFSFDERAPASLNVGHWDPGSVVISVRLSVPRLADHVHTPLASVRLQCASQGNTNKHVVHAARAGHRCSCGCCLRHVNTETSHACEHKIGMFENTETSLACKH